MEAPVNGKGVDNKMRMMGQQIDLIVVTLCLYGTLLAGDGVDNRVLVDNPYALDPGRACGPICLAFLDTYYGGNRSCPEIAKLCPSGPEGTSLEQLQSAARQLGYETLAFDSAAKRLEAFRNWWIVLWVQ